jgi:hypothetical protein
VAFYAWLDRRLLGESATSAPGEAQGMAKVCEPAALLAPNAAPRVQPTKSAVKRASSADRMRAKDQAALQALMA